MSTINKRLLKELHLLIKQQNSKPLLENDYLITFDEENINKVYSIIKAPIDSVYKHKFIRLDFDIPFDYPHSPPKVTFINYDGTRIHPNMYQDGKYCATILNTWPSENEKWTSSMGIETILLTFHSFLDNKPYTYEPGGKDNESYTDYILFTSWYTCFFRYLEYKQHDLFNTFIHKYILKNIDDIMNYIDQLSDDYFPDLYYCNCFEIDNYIINYDILLVSLQQWYNYINYLQITNNDETSKQNFEQNLNNDCNYKCNICFDTNTESDKIILINCKHSFHSKCLTSHIKNNGNICSLCRTSIKYTYPFNKKNKFFDKHWIINPIHQRYSPLFKTHISKNNE
jgi:ubiquitin-conjugating enzyme E2 G2